MAFDWREYLILAKWFQTNTPPGVSVEATVRCAVSRAYYSAFGYARTYAETYLGFQPRNDADDHGRLKAHLKQKRRTATSESLDRLRGWRNDCDYVDELSGDVAAMLGAALEDADYVFTSLAPPAPR